MNFTIRAYVGETRVSTAASYSKDNKNHLFQIFPEKKKFSSLRQWMTFYAKLNPATSFKMDPPSSPKPVIPDTPTQALVRKYYEGFGLENSITPRSHCTTSSMLFVYTGTAFSAVFFNRQTGMVKIGDYGNYISELPDLAACKFFVKTGNSSFKPIDLPVTSEPNPGQPVIAVYHNKYYNAFTYSPRLSQMKKLMTDAGYFVKDFYSSNYKKDNDMMKAIWSMPNIRASMSSSYYWYGTQEVHLLMSPSKSINVNLTSWLAANPASPPAPIPVASVPYPPLPSSPPPVPA